MARVVYRDENYQTFYVDVNDQQPEVTIGRNQGNMILIPAKSLSRYHAKIVYQNRRYFLIDLKSSNGTYVNNVRINQQEIHPGDLIRFGDVSVDFVDDNRNAFAGSMGASGGQSIAHSPMSSMGAPMNPPAPMPPQRPAMPPSMPPGPGKMSSPKIQMFNPGIQPTSSGPDLRSVSMRPISSGGTYRPTMPNQPAFDDSMAKMAEQIASPASPVAPTMDAAAAPATFDPNSMGLRPQPPQRNLVTPGSAPSMNPFVPPQKGIDPAAAPMSFNPGSMGIKPMAPRPIGMNAPEMPGPNKFAPPAQGGIDPGVAPVTFNPNSMGLMQTPPPSVDAGAPSIGGVPTAGPASMNSGIGSIPSGMMPAAAGVTAPSGGLDAFSHAQPDPNENSRFPGMSGLTAPSGLNASKNLISVSTLDPEQNTALHKVDQKDKNEDSVSPALEQIANELDSVSNQAESHEDDKNESAESLHHAPVRSSGDSFSPALSGISRRAARPNGFNRPSVSDVIPVPASAGIPAMPASSGSFSRQGRGVPGRTRMSTHFSPRSDSADNSQLPFQDDSANNEVHSGLEIPPQMNLDPISSEGDNKKIEEMNAGDFLPNDLPDSDKSLAMDLSQAAAPEEPEKDAAVSGKSAENAAAEASAESEIPHPSMASPKLPEPIDVEMFDELRHSLDIEAISCDSEMLNPVEPENPPEAEAAPADSPEPQKSQETSEQLETPTPESPVSQGDAQAASEAPVGASSEELDKMRAQLDSLQEQLDDANQMVKLVNAAMTELKELHQTQMDALKVQNNEEISQLNVAHLQELSQIKADSERLVSDAQAQVDALQTENESLKARIVEMEKAGSDAGKFVPKWSSRFDALIQYAKAMERAVDKLQLDTVEPKAFEYIRSMSDMIRFCADDLKNR